MIAIYTHTQQSYTQCKQHRDAGTDGVTLIQVMILGLNEMSARRSHLLQLGTLANHLVEWRCASAPLPSLLRRLHSLRAVLDAVRDVAFCFALRF